MLRGTRDKQQVSAGFDRTESSTSPGAPSRLPDRAPFRGTQDRPDMRHSLSTEDAYCVANSGCGVSGQPGAAESDRMRGRAGR